MRFLSEIKVGDYVITHNYGERTYFLGKIASNYRYDDKIKRTDPKSDNYWDVRDVEWLMEIPKNNLKKSTQSTLGTSFNCF